MTSEVAATGRRPKWVVAVRAILVVLACLVAAGAIYVRNVMKSRATPPPPLPSPNGYDDLVLAVGMMKGEVPNQGRIRGAKLDELRAWVASNAGALKVAREGLASPSRVPVDYNQDLKLEFAHMNGCRGLARLFAAEGEVAVQEGRPADALRSFLDGLRLGRAAGRGGLMVDMLAGLAIESQAIDGVGHVREGLPADAIRPAIAGLLEADKDRETFAEVRNTDDYWFEQTSPYTIRLSLRVTGVGERLRQPADQAAMKAIQRTQTVLRREAVALAQHLYFLETKDDPKSPADLVPAYLPAIPTNPTTGRPITDVE